jgi:hypothetical protein
VVERKHLYTSSGSLIVKNRENDSDDSEAYSGASTSRIASINAAHY